MKKKTKRVMKEKRKERTKRLDTITKMEMITKMEEETITMAKEEEQMITKMEEEEDTLFVQCNVESIILYSYPLHSSTSSTIRS